MENTTPVVVKEEHTATPVADTAVVPPTVTPVAEPATVNETPAVEEVTVVEPQGTAVDVPAGDAAEKDDAAPKRGNSLLGFLGLQTADDAPQEAANPESTDKAVVSDDNFSDPAPPPVVVGVPETATDASPDVPVAQVVEDTGALANQNVPAPEATANGDAAADENANGNAAEQTNDSGDTLPDKAQKDSTWRRICCCCCGKKERDTQSGESEEVTDVQETANMENQKAEVYIEGALARVDMLGREKKVWMRVRADGTVEVAKTADAADPHVSKLAGESTFEKIVKHKNPAIKIVKGKGLKALGPSAVFVFEDEATRDTWIVKLTELRDKLFPEATPAEEDAAVPAPPADAAAAPAANGDMTKADLANADAPAAVSSSANVSTAASGKAAP